MTLTPTATAAVAPTETPSPTSTAAGPATATPTPTPSTAQPDNVVITEILQNPAAVADTAGEWFEVYNAANHAIDLNGWTIADAGTDNHRIQTPNGEPLWLPAGGYLVLGRNADSNTNGGVSIAYRYTGFTLGNADDEIILLDAAGTEIDRVAYDGGPAFPNPDGAAMQLIRPDLDNALGANWQIAPDPWPGSAGDRGSPGTANPVILPTATATMTSTPTPTASPTATATIALTPTPTGTAGPLPNVRLNEILPRPDAVDWDGNGQADSYDEWIEIVNLGPGVADLGGWRLDDILGGGSGAYVFPMGTLLGPGEFLVRYRSTTGVALNQDADTANLLAPDGSVVDSFSYTNPGRDASYSRAADGTGDWTETYPPSPGDPNLPGTPPPTGAPTPTGTPTVTPTAVGTVTPTPTAGPLPLVRLNEILPRPDAIDWDGSGAVNAYDGWIEVINLDTVAIDMGGWALDDISGGTRPYIFPRDTLLGPGEFLVRYRSTTGVALNQDADTARLLAPDGREVDVFAYRNPGRDASYSRTVDGTGDWTDSYPPSPGGPNLPGAPTATATPSRNANAYADPHPDDDADRRGLRPQRAAAQRGAARAIRDRLERRRHYEHK